MEKAQKLRSNDRKKNVRQMLDSGRGFNFFTKVLNF